MPKYVKAKAGPNGSVVYTDSNGKQWVFKGGNRPWRNQNPGDLVPGKYSGRNGAIGSAGGFAVFPDYASGHAALLDLLKDKYGNSDIRDLMEAFAPKSDNNNTEAYIRFIRKRTGVTDDRKIKDFTKSEFEKLWQAIEDMEGWGKKPGKILPLDKKAQITGISKDKHGIINGYQIEGYGWVTKDEGIALAEQGKVDAVIAVSPHGHSFLKGRPGHAIS